MYPKNNASPPTVAVGSIYLIADGTIQTSGASVRVRTAGGAWGAGGGTLAYDTTSGAIEYTPTQAETNGEWFMVAVYKASCTSATVTVVTSESATAGRVSLGEILGGAQSATDLKDFADTGYDPSTHRALSDLKAIMATELTETSAGYLAAAFKKLFDVATPLLVASDVMRGTDSAALASVWTEARAGALTDWINGGRLDLIIDAILARLPAALVSGRMSVDAVAISGSTDAADKLEASAETMVIGAATATTLSTTQMSANLTEATDDHYNGRVIIWTSGVLLGQATDITDYNGTTKTLTFTAVTEAPGNTDTFVIV